MHIAECLNVGTDMVYIRMEDFWRGRLMFGTDLPVWQAHEDVSLTRRYREYVAAFRATGVDGKAAFASYLGSKRMR